jgi:MFS family permease
MLTLYFQHGLSADAYREIMYKFSTKYPEIKTMSEWTNLTHLTSLSAFFIGLLAGLIIATIHTIILNHIININSHTFQSYLSSKNHNSLPIKLSLYIITSFLLTFLITASIFNPYTITSIIDLLYAFSCSGLLGIITFIHAQRIKRDKTRWEFTNKKDIQLKIFETEHSEIKEIIHLITWTAVMILIAIITTLSNYINQFPKEISYSIPFWKSIFGLGLFTIIIFVGIYLGILYPYLCMLGDIYNALRYFAKNEK